MEKNKITWGTWGRTALLVLALINQCLVILGKSPLPIEDEQINGLVSTIGTVITSVLAWWKNNSFTQVALEADKKKSGLQKDKE